MPILNYTTQVAAERTAAEIHEMLRRHGATAVLTEFDGRGNVSALSFRVQYPAGEIPFRLPVDPDAVLRILQRQSRVPPRLRNRQQAVRVSWRIVRDWVEAQMALIDTEMVRMEQIFLPYAVTPSGQTVWERIAAGDHKLLKGGNDVS